MYQLPIEMDIQTILTDKELKAKPKVEAISKMLLEKKVSVAELIKVPPLSVFCSASIFAAAGVSDQRRKAPCNLHEKFYYDVMDNFGMLTHYSGN